MTRKNIIIAAMAAASAFAIAAPASAQSATGTVTINGTVSNKCAVVSLAGAATGDYTATRDLGELSQADGTLKPTATLEGLFGTTAATAPSFRVACTTATPHVSVIANPITTAGAAAAGYANAVNYTATATFALATGGPTPVSDDSSVAGATTAVLTDRLAGSGNNVTITTSNYNTAPGAILVAGSYTGTIVVVVSPT